MRWVLNSWVINTILITEAEKIQDLKTVIVKQFKYHNQNYKCYKHSYNNFTDFILFWDFHDFFLLKKRIEFKLYWYIYIQNNHIEMIFQDETGRDMFVSTVHYLFIIYEDHNWQRQRAELFTPLINKQEAADYFEI